MVVKKFKGKVYGAELTAAERKAMNIEIQKQLAEYDEKHAMEIDSMVLWQLHEQLGFGKVRLERFYRAFVPAYRELLTRYSMEDEEDALWLFRHKLKEIDVDVEVLYKETLNERTDI